MPRDATTPLTHSPTHCFARRACTVGVLQTSSGALQWPVNAELYAELAAAFREALPSEDAVAARMRRTDGDAVAKLLRRRKARAGDDAAANEDEPSAGAVFSHKRRRKMT